MKKVSKLKILTVVVMVMLIVFSAKVSFAQTITSIGNSTGNTANNTTINNVVNNVTENNTTNNVVNNTPVNNTVLPETGAASTTGIFILMALTSISAIYTFIKIRKYNI